MALPRREVDERREVRRLKADPQLPTVLGAAFAAVAARLRRAGVPNPEADAAWLLKAVTGLGPSEQRLRWSVALPEDGRQRLARLSARREAREPLQLILGETSFYGLKLLLEPGVLVPRFETEALVALALDDVPAGGGAIAIDVGCGSGAVALALASERPQARVLAADITPAAVALARRNARALGLEVEVLRSNLLAHPLLAAAAADARLMVANLPYLPESERPSLPPEVLWEPPEALFAGADGLREARRLRGQAWSVLPRGAVTWLELDPRNAAAFAREAYAAGWADVRLAPDLSGRRRFVRLLR